jgi:hypothetical protein
MRERRDKTTQRKQRLKISLPLALLMVDLEEGKGRKEGIYMHIAVTCKTT